MTATTTASTLETTDVLIVGAGPTGLALATTLKHAGVQSTIVDKLATGQNTSRAAVIHAHTLDVLNRIGAADPLCRHGLKLATFSIRDRDEVLLRLRFDALPSRYSHLLMLPQDETERLLNRALEQAGGEVRRSCVVESLVETAQGVEASVNGLEGSRRILARYVVGADGMHSLVRRTAGIGFAGQTYEESFVLADVDMEWGQDNREVMLFFSPAGLVVVAPLPSGAFRIVGTHDNAPEHPATEDIQAMLDARGPTRGGGRVSRVLWSSRFRLHHRVADRYRRKRLFLTGDAAHVHSPAGGQGMNTGLVDACVLGELLADVLSGRRPESHLDLYEAQRRPAAKEVLRLAGRLTHMATMKNAPQRFVRNLVLRTINRVPFLRRQLEMGLSGLSRQAAAELPALLTFHPSVAESGRNLV
jgi:2-polyprenyl-6-methoxyphenol hydroxylase-like FAD-dependent oxidoreductase